MTSHVEVDVIDVSALGSTWVTMSIPTRPVMCRLEVLSSW